MGEQTINRNAKISGGIKCFASDEDAILKRTLNRSMQAMEFADVKSSEEGYKSNRPSQILKSEKVVEAVMSVIIEEYMNPFDKSLYKSRLYNLSSRIQLDLEATSEI